MKTNFKNTVLAVWRLVIAYLAWLLAAVQLAANKASYRLTRRLVDKETLAAFDKMKNPAAASDTIDYRKKLIDLLSNEPEPIVGLVRERIEQTRPGQAAVRHCSDRHLYSVAYPTKEENIMRIMNAFDMFPAGATQNAYRILCQAIENSGELKL